MVLSTARRLGEVPEVALRALSGSPEVGSFDLVVPLVTVSPAGFPHLCLLSRSQLAVTKEEVHAAVRSSRAVADLRRGAGAVIFLIEGDSAISLRVRAVRFDSEEPGCTGVALRVVSAERDSAGVPLRPPRFLVTEGLARAEAWERDALVLGRLARGRGDSRTEGGPS